MPGFLEAGQRAERLDPALHVAVTGFPVVGAGAKRAQNRVRGEEPSRFHIRDEARARISAGKLASEDHAELVGEDLLAFGVHHTAAIAVAIEAEGQIGAACPHRVGHVAQHFQCFGIGVVVRKARVEFVVAGDDFDADSLQDLRCESSGGAVPGGTDRSKRPGHPEIPNEIRDIGRANPVRGLNVSAGVRPARAAEHDVAKARHVIGAMRQRRLDPIFTPVQPLGLWLAVTMATASTPRWNCAK